MQETAWFVIWPEGDHVMTTNIGDSMINHRSTLHLLYKVKLVLLKRKMDFLYVYG